MRHDTASHPVHNPLLPRFTRVLMELRWGDMDAYGHVNNVTQLRLLEEARVRAFGSPTANRDAVAGPDASVSGVTIPQVFARASANTELLVASHRIEYRLPIPYRTGPIAVDLVVSAISPVSITIGYVLTDPDTSAVYTLAETVIVFVATESGRPRRLTEEETAAFTSVLADPVPLRRSTR